MVALALILLGIDAIDAAGVLSPAVQKGIDWLTGEVTGNGTLASETGSIAALFQAREESSVTLASLASSPSALETLVATNADGNVEYTARRVLAAAATGQSSATDVAALLAQQNSDGGWGLGGTYQSEALDTALALQALAAADAAPSSAIANGLAFLSQVKQSDGGWGILDRSSIYASSYVLLAGSAWAQHYATTALTNTARDFLLEQRDGVSQVYAQTLDNALGLRALATQTNQGATLQPFIVALDSSQQADGSWADDPYVTALALRAEGFATQSSNPTTGSVRGRIVDQTTGSPLSGITVQLVENSSSTASAGDGSFAFDGMIPGAYTMRFLSLGYQTKTLNLQVSAGQIVNLGAIALTPAPLIADISGVVKNNLGNPLQNAIVATGTASTFTDATGAYHIANLNPGAAAITVSLNGYQAVTAAITFVAGTHYLFSPTLYATNVKPPATSLQGFVVDGATAKPIVGASIVLNGAIQTTDANGKFIFSGIAAGAFTLTIGATGYQSASATGTLVAGLNDVGKIPLAMQPASSTLSGTVTDADSHLPVAGASITVGGQGLTASSDANGNYSIAGIAGTELVLYVGATGYLTQTLNLTIPQIGNAALDVELTQPTALGISIDNVQMSKQSYAPNEIAAIDVQIKNATSNAVSLLVVVQVFDAQKNVVIVFQGNAKGLGHPPPNLPLIVAANSDLDVPMQQLLVRQAEGSYTAVAQAIDPSGRVVAEVSTQFSVAAQALLAGGLTPDPPLAQIGSKQAIALSADLTDVGNKTIAAGSLNLEITLENADTQTSTVAQASAKILFSGSPLNNAGGPVADAIGNLYTINYSDGKLIKTDTAGTSSVLATLPLDSNGQALSLDAQGNFWIGTSNGKLFQVTSQGSISMTGSANLTSISGIDFGVEGNLLMTGSGGGEQRLVSRASTGEETVLLRNGFSQPIAMVKDDAGNYVVTNYGDNTLSKVSSTNGAITAFASGLNRPQGIARDAQGNFYVANSGNGTISKITPAGQVSEYANGLHQPYDLKFDSNGTLFVSNQGDSSIVEISPAGSVQVFAQGVANRPQGMKYDSAGNLWIANDDGTLRKKDAHDIAAVVATGLASPRGVAIDSDGGVLVANYSNGTVTRTSEGTTTSAVSGLSSPYGIALDSADDVYVTETGANRISYFSGSGAKLGMVESFIYNPSQIRAGTGGEIYIQNSDSIVVIQSGTPRFLAKNFAAIAVAPDPFNGGIVATTRSYVYRIAADGSKTQINPKSLPFAAYGLGVDATGSILLLDYSGKKVWKLDSSGTPTSFAALPDYSQSLVTDLAGNVYVRLNNGTFYTISSSGVLAQIPVTLSEYIYGFTNAADGKLLIWTNQNRVYAVDPNTGVATLAVSNLGLNEPVASAAGNFYVIDNGKQELRTYDVSGALLSTLFGFTSPRDIVWTGTDFRFFDSASRLYSLAVGGYPVKMGNWSSASYLAWSNSQLFSTSSNAISLWTGSSAVAWQTVPGANLNGGIAARGDGAFSVADNVASRIVTLDSNKKTIADYAGISSPSGLAFDSQGRLYVANFGANTIARFDTEGSVPATFATVANPRLLSFDRSNNLFVSRSSGVDQFSTAGMGLTLENGTNVNGLFIDGTQLLGLSGINGQLLKWDGKDWNAFASGLSQAKGVHANGSDVYIANYGNGSVVKYNDGALTTVATQLPGVRSVNVFGDGNLYAGGDAGLLYRVGADGVATDMKVSRAINSLAVYGIVPDASPGRLYLLTYGYFGGAYVNNVDAVTITQSISPPPIGTVVYSATVPMPAMVPADAYTHLDLGSWLPPYGGDFKIDISRPDVEGGATNFVHVGPAANGTLSALKTAVPPGDQAVPMCLNLSGADFTSISRVETAQVRPLVSTGAPNGIAADKAGDIFFTDASNLYKVNPQGQVSNIAGGLKLRFGLAADGNENLYAASLNAKSGHFDLLRFDTTGTQTVVADLGVSQVNGLQVDSKDDVLVGSPGQLLKVNAQGHVSLVTMQGLPQPRGIAVDGRDNVYVQNETGYVSLIAAGGPVSDVFTKADGIVDPQFEGDGYPNIAADCADNFYIATSVWQKLGTNVQSGEEHTLAQVIARTGQISLLFDTLKISPYLSDIDYLAFDRFGNRILMWNHGQGNVWQVPVTCGAIGVQAHLVTQPGQTLTGISVPPSATIPQSGGGTEYLWSLKDVTASGQQICFDTTLKGLSLGEQRKTLDSGFITFENSFSANDVKLPLDIPSVQTDNLVAITVVTDQPDYPAKAIAQVTTTLTNKNAYEVDGTLVVDVYDSNGVRVGAVTQQGSSIPAAGSLPVAASFAIGTIIPGQYRVDAVLTSNGIAVAKANTTFNVLPDNVAASATSTVHTDRQTYYPSDRVQISSRVSSQSSNIILNNLTLMVQVVDGNGSVQFTHGYAIAQLLPKATLDFSIPQKLANAAAGTYTVMQELIDDQQRRFNQVETTYNVGSTRDTGFGLGGTIVATPTIVRPGEPLTLSASATNHGNADLDDLPLTIYIIDSELGTVVQQFTQTSTLSVDGSVPFDASWQVQGRVGATYLVILTATLGTGPNASGLTLAQNTFELAAQIAAGIQATGGTPQGTTITQPYPVVLEATVLDTVGNPLSGVIVTFAAPTSGASASFPSGNTAMTDTSGRARLAAAANTIAGSVVVTASATGVANTAQFNLQNLPPTASTVVASGGTPQTTQVDSAYILPLKALVQDNLGQPIAGVAVTFTAPTSGAGVTFPAGNIGVTDAGGNTSVSALANAVPGDFTVVATALNVHGSAVYVLTNTPAPIADADLAVTLTGPSSAAPGSSLAYTITLQNLGPNDAQNVQLSNAAVPGLALNGVSGACSTLPCSLGTVAQGVRLRIDVVFNLAQVYTAATLQNSVSVTSATSDTNLANNAASLSTRVVANSASSDVSIALSGPASLSSNSTTSSANKSSTSAPISPGADRSVHATARGVPSISYAMIVRNAGPSDADDVVVSVDTPAGLMLTSITGPCTRLPCSIGNLTTGQSLNLTATFSLPSNYSSGAIVTSASVRSTTPDPNISNNTATISTTFVGNQGPIPVPLNLRWILALLAIGVIALGYRMKKTR